MRARAFLRDAGCADHPLIQARIDFGQRVNDPVPPVTIDDIRGLDAALLILVEEVAPIRMAAGFRLRDTAEGSKRESRDCEKSNCFQRPWL